MRCLIDGDILLHELGWSGQFKDKETGEEVVLPFDKVSELLDNKIHIIQDDCYATEPPIIYLTESHDLVKMWNRHHNPDEPATFTPNFRYEVGKTKPYKGTRNNPKPFHFYNIAAYLIANYDLRLSSGGLEADDVICITQKEAIKRGEETIICSRDKDLRICEGWHYSWECGRQMAMGPYETTIFGSLHKKPNGDIYGYGLQFFFFQLLMGDSADNIPGCPSIGKAKAYKYIFGCLDVAECFSVVRDLYKEHVGDNSKDYFLEQAQLLWMRHAYDEPFNIRKLK